MSSANMDNLTSPFPIQIPFISFSYIIVLARNSSTALSKSGKSGHPCFIANFKGNGFSFSG
jgi:hypothetical protein